MHGDNEIKIIEYLKSNPIEHPGRKMVRSVFDSFEIAGPHGNHKCILYKPLGMSYTDLLRLLPESRFPKELVQQSIQLLLVSLDYLHRCNVVHTGEASIM
jgi:serine/threonine-protein kinase SRPK3